jgi:hypothetical protein
VRRLAREHRSADDVHTPARGVARRCRAVVNVRIVGVLSPCTEA